MKKKPKFIVPLSKAAPTHVTHGLNTRGSVVSHGLNPFAGSGNVDSPARSKLSDEHFYREPSTGFGRERYYPHGQTNRMRRLAREGRGEMNAFQAEVSRIMRTEDENLTGPQPRHIVTIDDVTAGLGLDEVEDFQIRSMLDPLDARFNQKEQTQRIFFARSRLVDVLRLNFKHLGSDVRQEIVRRAIAFWKRATQTDYGKAPTVRWEGNTMKSESPKLIVRLSKAGPIGGKYYKRIPTGKPDRPWKYFYTKEQWEKHASQHHVDGAKTKAAKVEHKVDAAWKESATILASKNTGTARDDLHYRAYMRAIQSGDQDSAKHLREKFDGAKRAMRDLIDMGPSTAPDPSTHDGARKLLDPKGKYTNAQLAQHALNGKKPYNKTAHKHIDAEAKAHREGRHADARQHRQAAFDANAAAKQRAHPVLKDEHGRVVEDRRTKKSEKLAAGYNKLAKARLVYTREGSPIDALRKARLEW